MIRFSLLCSLLLASFPRLLLAASAFSVQHQGVDFDIYRLGKGEEQQLRFFWKREDGTPYGSIHALREAVEAGGGELLFAVNGGIYSKQFTPLGLYIENRKRHYKLNRGDGGGNFFLLPNGVFYVTEQGARVVETKDYRPHVPVTNAMQSGPILVTRGASTLGSSRVITVNTSATAWASTGRAVWSSPFPTRP